MKALRCCLACPRALWQCLGSSPTLPSIAPFCCLPTLGRQRKMAKALGSLRSSGENQMELQAPGFSWSSTSCSSTLGAGLGGGRSLSLSFADIQINKKNNNNNNNKISSKILNFKKCIMAQNDFIFMHMQSL